MKDSEIKEGNFLNLSGNYKTAKNNKFGFIQEIDWILFVIVFLLTSIGFLMIFSATFKSNNYPIYLSKQLSALFIGVILMFFLTKFNYQIFKQYSMYVYIISILLLISVLFFGKEVKGTKAWLDFKLFTFQPSEISKILFILSLAAYLDKESKEIYKLQKLVIPLLMLFGNIFLILIEPDLSGAIVYFPVMLVMLYCVNAQIHHLLGIILYGTITFSVPLIKTIIASMFYFSPILKFFNSVLYTVLLILIIGLLLLFLWWLLNRIFIFVPLFYFICIFAIIISGICSSYIVDKNLKNYQKKRLITFISPKIDPLGAGYNITQSKIAIGSGRLFGKGLFNGTQGQLGFVPAKHTDFIFTLISEELGFIFSLFVVLLYFLLFLRGISIAKSSRNMYGFLIATGISSMFGFYAIINIGMVIGLMPVTGLPLPFISYGGSSIVSSFMSIGILFSIYKRRFIY